MTEPDASTPPPEPKLEPPRAPTHSPKNALAVFSALGFLLIAGALFFLWSQIDGLGKPDNDRLALIEAQIRTLQDRVAVLERRPVATAAPDLRPLESRIAALEQRPAAASAPADLSPLESCITAAEKTAQRAMRWQSAAAALEAGKPLGSIDGAPPALTRYATTAPPTLPALHQAFEIAAAKAEAASRPAEAPTMAGQVWQRLSGLVTVRRGATVLVGSPASVALGNARERIEQGDLAGAVAALDGLDPAAAKEMAAWREAATALLAARAALAGG